MTITPRLSLPLVLSLPILLASMVLARPAAALVCSVGVTPMAFGPYDPTLPTSTDSTATVSVACQNTVSLFVTYSVALSTGSSGTYAARKMLSGQWGLNYQIFTNASYTSIWGDGSGGSSVVNNGYLLAALVTLTNTTTAYGRILARQNVGPGTYNDTVLVTLTF